MRKSVGKSKKIATLAQKEVEVGLAKKKLGWEEIRDPTFYDFQEKYLRYLQAIGLYFHRLDTLFTLPSSGHPSLP